MVAAAGDVVEQGFQWPPVEVVVSLHERRVGEGVELERMRKRAVPVARIGHEAFEWIVNRGRRGAERVH